MKCRILFLWYCIVLLANHTYAQNVSQLSIEGNLNYYYYAVGKNHLGDGIRNKFNYGSSLMLATYVRNIKVSAGINISTKDLYYLTTPNGSNDLLQNRSYDI